MSLELAALAFFKKNKIHYTYLKPTIKFPCIECGNEAVMHAYTTNWTCSNCGIGGTIAKLIECTDESWKQRKLYNPDQDKNKIFKKLDELILEKGNDKNLKDIRKRIDSLINYYEQKINNM